MPSTTFFHRCFDTSSHQPKGAVIVMVAVLLVVILGCAALAVDIGYLYVARAELQRTADAAAMAGAQALGRASDSPFGEYLSAENIYSQAELYAQSNEVVRQGVVLNRNTDITIGYLANPRDRSAALQIVSLDQANAGGRLPFPQRRRCYSSNIDIFALGFICKFLQHVQVYFGLVLAVHN